MTNNPTSNTDGQATDGLSSDDPPRNEIRCPSCGNVVEWVHGDGSCAACWRHDREDLYGCRGVTRVDIIACMVFAGLVVLSGLTAFIGWMVT